MMTHNEMIEVIQAHRDGKTVQCRLQKHQEDWYDAEPDWNFYDFDYRIKPEPREWWVNVYKTFSVWYDNKEEADKSQTFHRLECRHVREVLPP